MDTSTQTQHVKDLWSREAAGWKVGGGVHWTEHPAVQRHISRLISGDEKTEALPYLITILRERGVNFPVARAATLGCGGGELERGLAPGNFIAHHDGFDIAEGAVKLAREKSKEAGFSGLHYHVADVNTLRLPPNTYDLIFVQMAAHHFANLEQVFATIARALKPGGVFYLNEFVGPTRFQWTDKQLAACNALLESLPAQYRKRVQDGSPKEPIQRPTVEAMIKMDPSEAVRAGEITKVFGQYFSILKRRDYGGTILHMLLEGIAGNFADDKPADRALLDGIFAAEDGLMRSGELTSDFTLLIGSARPNNAWRITPTGQQMMRLGNRLRLAKAKVRSALAKLR
jgi:ubiquinone/menaquinone biosynthesis C-methylase UbiE